MFNFLVRSYKVPSFTKNLVTIYVPGRLFYEINKVKLFYLRD